MLTNRGSLPWRGSDRLVAALNLSENELASGRSRRKCTKKIPIEPAHAGAQHLVPERDLGLFDGPLENDIETNDFCPAIDDGCENPADLAGPGEGWRPLERWGLVALFVDRDHDDRGGRAITTVAEEFPAQRREGVDRKTVYDLKRWRGKDNAGYQRNDDDRERISFRCAPHVPSVVIEPPVCPSEA